MDKMTCLTLEENKGYFNKADKIDSDTYALYPDLFIPFKLAENLSNLCFPDIYLMHYQYQLTNF